MILKIFSSILLMGLLTLFVPKETIAQTKQPVGLLADDVEYDPNAQVLTASGNVRIVSDGQILSANRVVFNEATGRLTIPDGFIITTSDGSIITGTDAELSADLSRNVIRGARILIANQLQLAADQTQYKDNRYKILDRVVASTCYICENDPIPFWQIRSNRVIHDEKEKQLYFEHATLELLGLPVFYAPQLRLPDPTVERASGFLFPTFFTSDLLKFGARIPYFIAIDDHSDATVTAYFATVGSFVAEGQYRRQTKNGYYTLDGALLLVDGLENEPFRSSILGTGRFNLKNDYSWGFDVDLASDRTYRAQYGFEAKGDNALQDRLFSQLYLERNRADSYFTVRGSSFQSLRTNEVDANIPFVVPEIYFRKIQDDPILGGKLGLTAHTTTLLRTGNNRFTRFGLGVDWQQEWQMRNGILFGARGAVDVEYYSLNNFTNFNNSSANRVTPTISADIRWPWSKTIGAHTHIIEPIVQLVWNEDSTSVTPNEDSVQVEFEETNLFSTNRFPGFDQKELGFRANVGINYTLYNPSGWNISATAGRIFRAKDLGQFSTASGLSGKNSDWVGAVSIRFKDKFEITNRALFNSQFDLSKYETSLSYTYEKMKGEATFLWLIDDVIAGASDRRREASFDLEFTPRDNWTYLADFKHDFITNSLTEGKFGVKYTNECIEIDLSLSLQYTASGNVSPAKELGLTVKLLGIGKQSKKKQQRHRCAY